MSFSNARSLYQNALLHSWKTEDLRKRNENKVLKAAVHPSELLP